jgi:hypothetical protein
MRAALILALMFLFSAEPALACHHYSSWSYPWPQSCRVSTARAQPHRTWFVEIATPPPAPALDEADDLARARAVDTLKQELRLLTLKDDK